MTSNLSNERRRAADRSNDIESVLKLVRKALEGLEFGNVKIVVQNGRPIQIEREEKTRVVVSD